MKKNDFWHKTLLLGAITGVVMALLQSLTVGLKLQFAGLGLLMFLINAALIWFFVGRYVRTCGDKGCSYADALGFCGGLALFSAIVYSLLLTFMMRVVLSDVYMEQLDTVISQLSSIYGNTGTITPERMTGLLSNPIALFMSNLFGMVFRGVFIGLVVSAIVKRAPVAPGNTDRIG